MNISHAVYESLSPQQRIIATVEAEARGDQAEVEKLVKSCPKKHYSMADASYSEVMEALEKISLVMCIDIHMQIENFFLAYMIDSDTLLTFVQNILNIRTAYANVMNRRGIDPKSMERSFMPPNPFMQEILDFITNEAEVEPDFDDVKLYDDLLEDYLVKIEKNV